MLGQACLGLGAVFLLGGAGLDLTACTWDGGMSLSLVGYCLRFGWGNSEFISLHIGRWGGLVSGLVLFLLWDGTGLDLTTSNGMVGCSLYSIGC